jgi:PAS domain S-box-containing protein
MKLGLKITVIFVVVLLIIGIVGIQSYLEIQRLIESNSWVIHTHEVNEKLEHVLSLLKDAETGQRGFVLTGEDSYLEPYNAANTDTQKDIEAVTALTLDNPEQQKDLQRLQKLSRDKLDELQETIKLRREAGMEAAIRVIRTDSGKRVMDEIRALMNQMKTRENELLESRNRVASEIARRSVLMVGFGVLLSMMILGIAAVFVTRTMQLAEHGPMSKDADKKWWTITIRYAFAVGVVGLAVAARSWLEGFGPMPLFITFYPGVLLVASSAGGGPGVLFTFLAVLAADYWFLSPVGSFAINSPSDALALGIFGGSSLLLSVLAERLQRARRAEAVSVTQEKELALLNMGNLMTLTLDHRIAHWSEGNHRLYGFDKQEAQGQLTYELLRTNFSQPMEEIHNGLTEKNYWEGEVTRRTKDGSQLSVAILWALRRDEGDKPLAILEVSTDITRQKLAEESLQQQSEELSEQNEELAQQSEELAQQSEELSEQNEELQTQSEEIQALNSELGQREKMLQTLLDAARLPIGEQEVIVKICHATQEIFGQPATGTVVYEQHGDELKILAHAGFDGDDIPVSRPLTDSFVEVIIQQDHTASLEDTSLRPDLNILSAPGHQRFAAVLSSPLHIGGKPIGAISIYSSKTQQWTVEQFRLIEWLAAQCSHALEAMRLAAEVLHSQKQNEFLANIIEVSSQAFGVGYPDGMLGLTNKAFEQLTGYRGEELRAIDWARTLTPPEWLEIEQQKLDELHRTGLPVRYEKEYIRKDGSRVPIELLVHLVSDSGGKPLYYYSFITDIRERKRTENELRKRQNLLNEMGRIAKLGGWEFNIETLELQWTEEVYHIHEVELSYNPTVSEAINFYAPSSRPVIAQAVRRAIEFGEPWDLNLEMVTAKGNHRWVQAIGNADRAHKIVKGTFQDITDRKQAEEALQKSQELFRTLADSIPNLAWWANGDGYITWYNRRWYEYTGTTPEQMEGWGWQSVHDPNVLPKVLERWTASIATGEPFDMEFPLLGADGVFRPFLTRVMPLKDTAGLVVRWFGTNTDISAQKQAEDEIKRLNADLLARNEQLEFANKELESFIYSVSHDLRAPLRHISGFTELVMKNLAGKVDEKGKRYLSTISKGTEKMSRLIDDLLNLSRISKQEIQRTEVNLSEIAASIVTELRESHPGRSVEVDIKEGLTALADRGLMEGALSNLLGNAWKFTAKTESASIEFGSIGQNGKVFYYVRDNGAGFDQKYAGKMFWPFHRLHSEEAFEGTGIGLAIVERIIRSHGGKVWAEGTEGKGATIYFSLN